MTRELKWYYNIYSTQKKTTREEQKNENDMTYEKQRANPIFPVITLHANELNTSIKSQRLAKWI